MFSLHTSHKELTKIGKTILRGIFIQFKFTNRIKRGLFRQLQVPGRFWLNVLAVLHDRLVDNLLDELAVRQLSTANASAIRHVEVILDLAGVGEKTKIAHIVDVFDSR